MASRDFTKQLFVVGITLSGFAAGGIASLSLVNVPSILAALKHPSASASTNPKDPKPDPEPLLLSQWATVYNIGSVLNPSLALLSATAHLLNAYAHYAPTATATGNALGGAWGTRRAYTFIATALTVVAIGPFTSLVMLKTNTELHAREEEGRGVVGEWTKMLERKKAPRIDTPTVELMQWWANLNLVRSLFPLFGTVLAFEAL